MNLRAQNQIYKSFAEIIRIYSWFSSICENIFIRKFFPDKNFKKEGIFKLSLSKNINQTLNQILDFQFINHTYTSIKLVDNKDIGMAFW